MMCTKCAKKMNQCRCPDAVQRLKWILGSDCPFVFSTKEFAKLYLHLRELEGERELKPTRKSYYHRKVQR